MRLLVLAACLSVCCAVPQNFFFSSSNNDKNDDDDSSSPLDIITDIIQELPRFVEPVATRSSVRRQPQMEKGFANKCAQWGMLPYYDQEERKWYNSVLQ